MPSTKVNNYTVIKNFDVQNSLNKVEKEIFKLLLDKIRGDKIANSYYVVNTDEPYANNVLNEIFMGEIGKVDLYETIVQAVKDTKSNFNAELDYVNTQNPEGIYKHTKVVVHPLLGDIEFKLKYVLTELFSEFKEGRHYTCKMGFSKFIMDTAPEFTLTMPLHFDIKEID